MSLCCARAVSRASGARRKATCLGLGLVALACAASPRPISVYELGEPSPSECPHPVALLSAGELARPYRELARLSATCHPLSPHTCEEALLWRGCQLGADAVVIQGSSSFAPNRGLPSTKSGSQSRLVADGIAVRYDPVAAAP